MSSHKVTGRRSVGHYTAILYEQPLSLGHYGERLREHWTFAQEPRRTDRIAAPQASLMSVAVAVIIRTGRFGASENLANIRLKPDPCLVILALSEPDIL